MRTYRYRGITITPIGSWWRPLYPGAKEPDDYHSLRATKAAIDYHLDTPWDCHGTYSETPYRHSEAFSPEVTRPDAPDSDQLGSP